MAINEAATSKLPFWKRTPVVGLVLWLIVVPAALAALGAWQIQRSATVLANTEILANELPQTLEKVRDIAANEPMAMLQFGAGNDMRSMPATMALAQIENAVASINTDLQVARVRAPMAWGTVIGSLLSLVAALLGLIAATVAGLRAKRSRDQLILSFERLRVILPFLLAAVIAGFSVAIFCGTLFESLSLWFWERVSGNGIKLVVGSVVLACIAIYGAFTAVLGLRQVFSLFTPEPMEVQARIVTETEAPGLWRFVRELGRRQDALVPDTIIVGLTDGFYVTEAPVHVMPEDRLLSGRTLHLPAPHLELLDTSEVAAIVGHELAHFTGDDTSYSTRFAPIYAGLWRALNALQLAKGGGLVVEPALRLGFHAAGRLDVAVAHWSRLREFEADKKGSLVSGPKGAASALIRTSITTPAVHFSLNNAFERPEASDANLVAAMAELVRQKGLPDPAEHLEDRQPHPTDSHPPTSQRIAALGVTLDDTLLARATRMPDGDQPSFGKKGFRDWEAFCATLGADFLGEARQFQTQYQQDLETAAAAVVEDEVIIYDNTKGMIVVMAISAALFVGVAVAVFVMASQIYLGDARILVAGFAFLIGLAFAFYAYKLSRRFDAPLMVLTRDTLISPRLDAPIAWTDVATYGVYAVQRFSLVLVLHPNAPLPKTRRWSLYTKVKRKKRTVTLDAFGIRGMKPGDFSDLVGRYLQAAYARRELEAKSIEAA
ncbi:M48 family metalloprotease [Tianweitania sp. BSSL-BM11]|uniref:M48 family metalloprotease n=1 Tax=Tianweitania aestuarii TaxID=2814886 RepID=A0ABS5RY30_9HYPH|nr:M48 family metallopeptidase [Tianweitania aestuarii]MBS9721953.1 M48 family metalloprotease [Tianweitania aestuarii]